MEILFGNMLAGYEGILLILFLLIIIAIFIIDIFFFSYRISTPFSGKRKSHAHDHSGKKSEEAEISNENAFRETEKHTTESSQKEIIMNLVSIIRTKIARGEIADAQAKIVEGLSLDKHNRELNMLLAEIYENIGDYRRAEILYEDMIPLYEDDEEIYEKLGDSLVKQEKYDSAYEIFTKLLSFSHEREKIIYSLAFVSYHTGKMDEVSLYGKEFLHNHPYDPDMLWIVGQAETLQGEYEPALEHLKKLRQLSPYNQEVIDQIAQIHALQEESERARESAPESEESEKKNPEDTL